MPSQSRLTRFVTTVYSDGRFFWTGQQRHATTASRVEVFLNGSARVVDIDLHNGNPNV